MHMQIGKLVILRVWYRSGGNKMGPISLVGKAIIGARMEEGHLLLEVLILPLSSIHIELILINLIKVGSHKSSRNLKSSQIFLNEPTTLMALAQNLMKAP